MSVMLTLISTRPIFFSSGSSDVWMLSQELVAVAVDVLDPHRGDHLAELAEDDVAGLLLDLLGARGRAGGWPRSASSPASVPMATVKTLGHVDADVLDRQGALERDLDLDRLEVR